MKSQFGKIIRDSDNCVICTQNRATTKEHIPPDGVFLKKPSQYITVPACDYCNQSTKLDDEYLRQVMSAGSQTIEGRQVWDQKVAPKFKDFPKTQAGLRDQVTTVPAGFPQVGLVELPGMKLNMKRIQISANKLVRGLYWFHTGTVMRLSDSFVVSVFNILDIVRMFEDPDQSRFIQEIPIGLYRDKTTMQTFFYQGAIFEQGSFWLFHFYRQNVIFVRTAQTGGSS